MSDKPTRPQTAPQTGAVLENNELRKTNYKITTQVSMHMFVIVTASIALNFFLGYLAFFRFPLVDYIPTSNAAAICKVVPVSEPFLTQAEVANFAVDAAVSMYTYDHQNYRKQVTDTTEKYFTPEYRNEYLTAFGDSKNLQVVVENYFVVTATTAGRPAQIVKVGTKSSGAYFWKVQVPINVYYVSGRKKQEEKLLAEIEVLRTPASRLNPKGIGVNGSNIRQLLN